MCYHVFLEHALYIIHVLVCNDTTGDIITILNHVG